jgi:hypothetical protein
MDDGRQDCMILSFYDLASVAFFTVIGSPFLFTFGRIFFGDRPSIGILLRSWCWLQRAGRVPSLTFSDERLGWLFWFCVAVLYIFPLGCS